MIPTNDQLEILRVSLGIGLVVANVAVWTGVYMENDRFSKPIQDKGWKILVVALAAEAAFAVVLLAADTTIGLRQKWEIIALEERTSQRPWTKEQFDAIQELKGSAVTDVAVIPEPHCIECFMFASHLEMALHVAGIALYKDMSPSDWQGTGLMVYCPPGFDPTDNPLAKALKNAGLEPVGTTHTDRSLSPYKVNVWVIMVGERWPAVRQFPFFPQSSDVPLQWQYQPLRR